MADETVPTKISIGDIVRRTEKILRLGGDLPAKDALQLIADLRPHMMSPAKPAAPASPTPSKPK